VCCGAYVAVRYHISKSFIFTDFDKSCSLPGCGLFMLADCCGHVCCRMLLCGVAAGYHCPGVLPQHLMLRLPGHCLVLLLFCLGRVGSMCLWLHMTQAATRYSLASRL
jgi:hypothetical protein